MKSKIKNIIFTVFIFICIACIMGCLISTLLDSPKNAAIKETKEHSLKSFPEDPDNEKYTTLDADNIFSEEFKTELIEYEQKEIENYLTNQKIKTEENDSEENTAESIPSEGTEIPDDLSSLLGSSIETKAAPEYHFEAFNDLKEKEKNEKISKYVDALLNTIITQDYTEDDLFENASAEEDSNKDLLRFMLSKLFEDESINDTLSEEYNTWYGEYSKRITFENIIKELQFVSIADKNYICLRSEMLKCPSDVTDITKCNMSVTMIGKQDNSYFYIVTDNTYEHQYLITFASEYEYSIMLYQ